jgi:hypothetical protein
LPLGKLVVEAGQACWVLASGALPGWDAKEAPAKVVDRGFPTKGVIAGTITALIIPEMTGRYSES